MEDIANKTTDEKISEIYYEQSSFGSLANTYNDVKRKYPNITREQVE